MQLAQAGTQEGGVAMRADWSALADVFLGVYGQRMLTIASRLDVMNRLGRALADPTRSRIILTLLDRPAYPAELARDLDLTRSNVSNHLACLRDCGLVTARPEGRASVYSLQHVDVVLGLLAAAENILAVLETLGVAGASPDAQGR